MTRRFEEIYGYWNAAGVPKKVAQISGKKAADNYLLDLCVIQYDMCRLMHFTLHNTTPGGKTTKYQIQTDCRKRIALDDRDKFPDVIESPLPDFRSLTRLHTLQTVPIHAQADDERDFYPTMPQGQLNRFAGNMADFRRFAYDRNTPGILEFYLVPEGAAAALDRFHERIYARHGEHVRLWTVCKDVVPWVLCYVKQGQVARKVENCRTTGSN